MKSSSRSASGLTRRRFLERSALALAGLAVPLVAACSSSTPAAPTTAPAATTAPSQPAPTQPPASTTQAATPTTGPAQTGATPAPQPATGTRKAGGTINVWQPNGWPEQAWHMVSNWESGWAISPQAEPLFWVKQDSTLEPLLAESLTPSADGLKWTLKLRKNAKWSDGQPITAADFEFGVLAHLSPDNKPLNELSSGFTIKGIKDYVNGKAPSIEGIKVVDEKTAEVILTDKDASLPNLWFGDGRYAVLPKHAIGNIPFKELAKDKYWITNPVASGPYKLTKYVSDQYIEYERNPNYWDDKPRPDKMLMRISSPEVAIVSLQKGELDIVNPLQLTEVARLKGDPKINIVEAKNNGQWYGLERNFYTKNGLWRNPKAVQGLWYAIDRQAYVNSILQGYGAVRNSFYDGTIYACPNLTKYDYNPEMAKKLWEEAGVPKDKPITFMSWPGIKARMDFLPIAQEYVRKLGYKAEVDFIDNSLIQNYLTGKGPRSKDWDFQVLLFGPGTDPGGAAAFVDPKSTSNWAYRSWPVEPGPDGKKQGVDWVYNNPKMSELFGQGRLESDPEKRKAIYQQIDCIWNQELPCLMIASPSFMLAKSARAQGIDWQTNAGFGNWTAMYKPGDWWLAQ